MTSMSSYEQSRLNVACFLLLIKVRRQHGSFSEWRAFAEWLGGYQYIPPNERVLSKTIWASLVTELPSPESSKDCFTIWLLCTDAENHLTMNEQLAVSWQLKDILP